MNTKLALAVVGLLASTPLLFAAPAERQNQEKSRSSWWASVQAQQSFIRSVRAIEKKQEEAMLADAVNTEASRRASSSLPTVEALALLSKTLTSDLQLETAYLVTSQFFGKRLGVYGAINNVYGAPTWIVPRENALAIMAFIQSAQKLGDSKYLNNAQIAADYLLGIQDMSDGAWFDQYSYNEPTVFSKSPTQTAEVLMAFNKLGYVSYRYDSVKKGAQYLISLQNPANNGGVNDGLIGGGKNGQGGYHTWRWASDNSYAYLALKAAESWATKAGDAAFATTCKNSAARILSGINNYMYVSNTADPDFGVWRRVIDQNHNTMESGLHDWINYAPQMLDIPATGVGQARVGEWIHRKLQKSDGSVVWNDGAQKDRKSPGFSFQAALVWQDLGQTAYANSAINWARNSGLWQTKPDVNGVKGGWIDWTENGQAAPFWQRFIDTSFYAMSAFLGGYNFRS